jgi:hypothetical protein
MKREFIYLLALGIAAWTMRAGFTEAEQPGSSEAPAVEDAQGQPEDGREDGGVKNEAADQTRVQDFAKAYGVSELQVYEMRELSALGWGEIRNLLQIAQHEVNVYADSPTPLTMEQAVHVVRELRKQGMGIGDIAQNFDTKLGELNRVGNVSKAEAPAGKPAKARQDEDL